MSSGSVTSSALTHLDDAANILLFMNSTTTSGADVITVQVEPTDTGSNFAPLLYNSSAAGKVVASSSGWVMVSNIAFRQMRFTSSIATGVGTGSGISILACKQITV